MKNREHLTGQTLIEFALIFPLLVLLLVGLFDLGRAVFYYSSLSNAVREAARAGTVMLFSGDSKLDIAKLVQAYGFGLNDMYIGDDEDFEGEDVKVVVTTIEDEYFENYIEVEGRYCYKPITPGIISIINSTCWNGSKGIELWAVSVMRLEPGTK